MGTTINEHFLFADEGVNHFIIGKCQLLLDTQQLRFTPGLYASTRSAGVIQTLHRTQPDLI